MTQATIYSVPLVGPATPTAMAQRIDDNFDAIISGQSGASRPSYAVAGMVWQDTSVAGLVKYNHYDGSDDILLNTIDTTNNRVVSPPQAFATVASAATTDIGAVTSQNVTVTGTTTITAFGTVAAGTFRRLRFSGSLTLTHNGTSLILPNASNILTTAGDTLEAVSLGSGNWVVTSYDRASSRQFISNPATTSGTSIDVDIPPGATKIAVHLIGVSTNGTSIPIIQLGTASSFEATNYIGSVGEASALNFSTGFALVRAMSATAVLEGRLEFDIAIQSSNTWVVSGSVGRSDAANPTQNSGGRKALSGALTRIRLTTTSGADTFDAGSIAAWASF